MTAETLHGPDDEGRPKAAPQPAGAAPGARPLAVLALGGNALLRPDEEGTHREQSRGAARLAKTAVAAVRDGYRVLVVHGNGPQVGRELLRSEEAALRLPPRPLDVCVATTQGSMGYRIGLALRNGLKAAGLAARVASLNTQVLVRADDAAFQRPTKPIGPSYTAFRAREVARAKGWHFVEDAGRGWRQVVASPRPVDILELDAVEALLDSGHIVVAGGGGGVPVAVDDKGAFVGVEAVIDKDRTATLFANHLGADVLCFVTGVEHVYLDFGRATQRPLGHVTQGELAELYAEGRFAEGSIGPKVGAALDFVAEGGRLAIITSGDKLQAALNDRAGTRVSQLGSATGPAPQMDLFAASASAPADAEAEAQALVEGVEPPERAAPDPPGEPEPTPS